MLEELIKEGEDLKQYLKEGMIGKFLTGEKYSLWLAKCVRFLEINYPNSQLTERFIEESKNAVGESEEIYYNLLGIVKAFKEIPDITKTVS